MPLAKSASSNHRVLKVEEGKEERDEGEKMKRRERAEKWREERERGTQREERKRVCGGRIGEREGGVRRRKRGTLSEVREEGKVEGG